MTVGHWPQSIDLSTVGGWLACRGAGQHSTRYGKIEDIAVSVTFVTGAGERIVTAQRPFSGPDLTQVLIGSEGTLGVFTAARLRVFPLPAARVFRGLQFESVGEGIEAMRQIFRAGLRPAVARLYERVMDEARRIQRIEAGRTPPVAGGAEPANTED